MLFILNRQEKVVGVLKNSGKNSVPFFNDLLTEDLATGSETFEFTTVSRNGIGQHLVVGNFIAFKKGKSYKLFQIMQTEEDHQDELYITVYAECAGLQLINSVFRGVKIVSASFERVMQTLLSDTSWNVGILPYGLATTYDLDIEEASVYSLLQTYAQQYGVELEFRVELNRGKISKKYIDGYYNRGKVTGKRFTYERDIEGIVRKTDATELYTALIGRGNNGISFKDVTVDGIDKPMGQDFVANQSAYEKYNNNGYHIVGIYEYDTNDAKDLLRKTHKRLLEVSKPKVEYDISVVLLCELLGEKWNEVAIGDTISVFDNAFYPPIMVSARVSKLQTSMTDKNANKCTLANFIEVKSNITSEMRKIASQLQGYVDNRFPIGSSDIQDGAVGMDKINDIYTQTITTDILRAGKVETEKLIAKEAEITNAKIENLKAGFIEADKIITDTIVANKAELDILEAKVGKIDTLVSGNISSDNIQTGGITGSNLNMDTIFVKDANILDLSASKLTAGEINTSKVVISSADGGMRLVGSTQQFVDENNRIRIQLGKDANGDFDFYILAENGDILFNTRGITGNAIENGLIKENMVSDGAIGGKKINWSSFVTEFNKDSNTHKLNSSKVLLDGTNQTLDIHFNRLNSTVNDNVNKTESNTTQLNVHQGKINTLIQDTTITKDGQTLKLKDEYSKLEQTVGGLKSTVGEQQTTINQNTGKITATESKVSTLEQTVNGFNSELSHVKTTIDEQEEAINSVNSALSGKANSNDVYKKSETMTTSAINSAINQSANSINLGVSQTYETKTNVETKVNNAVNNIQIGGRNLAKKGCLSKYNNETTTTINDSSFLTNGGATISRTAVYHDGPVIDKLVVYEAGKPYNMSFKLKANTDGINSIHIYNGCSHSNTKVYIDGVYGGTFAQDIAFPTDKNYHRVDLYFNAGSTNRGDGSNIDTIHTILQPMKNTPIAYTMQILNFTISAGNKPMDWTPAPEDVNNSIDSKANSSDVYRKSEVYTKSQTDSAINIAKDSINLGVSQTYETKTNVENKISTAVNNVQIGGKNLIKDSNFIVQATQSAFATTKPVVLVGGLDLNATFLGKTVSFSYFVHNPGSKQNGSGSLGSRFGIHGSVQWRNSSTGATTIYYPFADCLDGTYKNTRVSMKYTFNPPSGYDTIADFSFSFQPLSRPASGNSEIWKLGQPKLEIGTKSTDWSPAPEDIDSAIGTKANSTDVYKKSETYTKSETDSKINVAKDQINLSVSETYETKSNVESKVSSTLSSAKSYADTKKVEAITTSRKTVDTRNDNQTPQWYFNTYPTQTITEFKYADVMGLSHGRTYGTVETKVPWHDSSGGYPVQTWRSNSTPTYERKGLNTSTWGTWVQIEDTIGSQNKANVVQNNLNAFKGTVYTKSEVYTKSQTDSAINVAKNEINLGVSKVEQTARLTSTAKMLYTDIDFRKGGNGVYIYNNSGNGTVTLSRVSKSSDCPTTSTHMMQITTNGSASPGHGGFYFANDTRPNAVFITKFLAKIPAGYTLSWHSNAIGDGGSHEWLTSTSGTGKWEEYICKVNCGSSGAFSSTNFFALNGGSIPVTWYLGMATVYDLTDTSRIEERINSAESKITDSAIINTVQNTINTAKNEAINSANSSTDTKLNNYATKSSLTQTANNITAKFESSGGYNLLKNSGFKNDITHWTIQQHGSPTGSYGFLNSTATWGYPDSSVNTCQIRYSNQSGKEYGLSQKFNTAIGKTYTISFYYAAHRLNRANIIIRNSNSGWLSNKDFNPQSYSGGNSNISNWGKISLTFTATETSHILNIVAVNGQDDGYFWIAKPQIVEGEVALPYSPHPDEIYSGSTVIDASGVTVNNGALRVKNNAGTTVLSGDSNGNLVISGTLKSESNGLYASLSSGGLTLRDSQKSEEVLRLNTSFFESNRDMNGVTFAMPQYADFMRFVHIAKPSLENGWSSSDTTYKFMDFWSSEQKIGSTTYEKGIHTFAPIYARQKIQFKNNSQYTSDIIPNLIWNSISDMLGICGDNGLFLGYRNGETYHSRLVLTEGAHPGTGDNIRSWGNWNCSGYTVHNGTFNGKHVSSYANTYTRTSAQTHCIEAEQKQIRVNFEDVQLVEGKAILNIPRKYVGIHSGYIVSSIVKKGRGDVWVSEETENRFTLEGTDDIKVNVEIVVKLEEASAYSARTADDSQLCFDMSTGQPIV